MQVRTGSAAAASAKVPGAQSSHVPIVSIHCPGRHWSVGGAVGKPDVGEADGQGVGIVVGLAVGFAVGLSVGFTVGLDVGFIVGLVVGLALGPPDGGTVDMVGFEVGAEVAGALEGVPLAQTRSEVTVAWTATVSHSRS